MSKRGPWHMLCDNESFLEAKEVCGWVGWVVGLLGGETQCKITQGWPESCGNLGHGFENPLSPVDSYIFSASVE